MAEAPAHSKNLNKREDCDVAIIGGGLAGGLAAIHLARAGFHVVLFEKEAKPTDKVCGDFLSHESLPLLCEVGIDPIALGGVQTTELRLHGPRYSSSLKLPLRAVAISRLKLDAAVLTEAAASGADIRRGVRVTEILEGLDETTCSILLATSEGEIRAQRLIVASGKTDLKGASERLGRDAGYAAFKMRLRLKPSIARQLQNHADLFVFDRGYGSLTDLGHGEASLAFVIERPALDTVGSDWASLTAHIGKSCWRASHFLDGAEPQARDFISTLEVPIGYLRRTPPPAGLFFVGDQMAVLPAMTGEGMTVALMTARSAVEAMIEVAQDDQSQKVRLKFAPQASRDYQREMRAALRPQIDASLALQEFFKNPRLVDLATFALSAFPAIFRRIYKSTRCRPIDHSHWPLRGSILKKSPRDPSSASLIGV